MSNETTSVAGADGGATADRLLERCEKLLSIVGDRAEGIASAADGTNGLTRFANSMIHQNHAEDGAHISLTAVVDGRYASASTNKLDDASLQRLADRAIEAANLRPVDPLWPGLAPVASAPEVDHYDEATAAATPADRAEVVRAFVAEGKGLEAAGYCSTSETTRVFANSAGQRLSGRSTSAEIDGIFRTGTSDGAGVQSSIRLSEIDGQGAGAQAAVRARLGSTPVDVEPGAHEVVLDPSCLADMLVFLGMGFSGKMHNDGTSYVHLGEQQFDESVNLVDDPTDPRAFGLAWDGEGTPRERREMVVDGVTQQLFYDRRTANEVGTEPTGHGPGNLFFSGGSGTVDDLIASVERGLYVCDFWYTRILDPKTQVVTGLTRNGLFVIDHGKLVGAANNLRFTQSYVAALGPGKIKAIAGDARMFHGMHVPSIHLASWNFTGGGRG